MAKFIVKGPFKVPVEVYGRGRKDIDEERIGELLKECATFGKKGCYVFSIQAGRGSKPLYVGKTSRQTIIREAFNDRNMRRVVRKLNKQDRGTLLIWTITQDGGRRPPTKMIGEIEKMLIPWAAEKNPDLINDHHTKKSDDWSIEGVVGAKRGPRGKTANDFRKMIGISDQTQSVSARSRSSQISSPSSMPTESLNRPSPANSR